MQVSGASGVCCAPPFPFLSWQQTGLFPSALLSCCGRSMPEATGPCLSVPPSTSLFWQQANISSCDRVTLAVAAPPPPPGAPSSALSVGAIVGIVIGGLVAAALVLAGWVTLSRYRQKKRREAEQRERASDVESKPAPMALCPAAYSPGKPHGTPPPPISGGGPHFGRKACATASASAWSRAVLTDCPPCPLMLVAACAAQISTRHFGSMTRFSEEELAKACDDFDADCILGEGGFAVVYKGRLEQGLEVAIKRIKVRYPLAAQRLVAQVLEVLQVVQVAQVLEVLQVVEVAQVLEVLQVVQVLEVLQVLQAKALSGCPGPGPRGQACTSTTPSSVP